MFVTKIYHAKTVDLSDKVVHFSHAEQVIYDCFASVPSIRQQGAYQDSNKDDYLLNCVVHTVAITAVDGGKIAVDVFFKAFAIKRSVKDNEQNDIRLKENLHAAVIENRFVDRVEDYKIFVVITENRDSKRTMKENLVGSLRV